MRSKTADGSRGTGLGDPPPRGDARAAVDTCRTAGIRPVMITGDHPLTAGYIATELGIDGEMDDAEAAFSEAHSDLVLPDPQPRRHWERYHPVERKRIVQRTRIAIILELPPDIACGRRHPCPFTPPTDRRGGAVCWRLRRAQPVQRRIADDRVEVVLTTGGTGLTGRDGTPEAITPLLAKMIDGFGEVFRAISFDEIGTSALQSRAIAGVANGTVVFCLPGSTGACRTGWDRLIREQLDIGNRPCNLAELMPRLRES